MKFMKKKAEEQFSDPKLDGLKMEKSEQNFSLISREGIMKKDCLTVTNRGRKILVRF